MIKCANPTATMNVSTEVTEKTLELCGSDSDNVELGVKTADSRVLGLGTVSSSKISLWKMNALVVSSRSASIQAQSINLPRSGRRLIDPTFQLDVVPDASIDTPPEPFLDSSDFVHTRHGRVTLPLAPHDTKLEKRRSLLAHETVRLANVPLHDLSPAEISHVSDIGVGQESSRLLLYEVGQTRYVCVKGGWR